MEKLPAIKLLEKEREFLTSLVPKNANGFTVMEIIRQADECLRENDKLKLCDPASIATAVRYACQLGLNIHGPLRQAYLIPYGKDCKFGFQYQGLIDLVSRSGIFSQIRSAAVYENDNFEVAEDFSVKHKFKLSGRGSVIGFYAMAKHKNGEYYSEIMSVEEVQDLEKKTRKGQNMTPAWRDWFNEMGRKTVMHRLIKWIPKSGVEIPSSSDDFDDAEILDIKYEPTPEQLTQGKEQKKAMEDDQAIRDMTTKLDSLTLEAKNKLNEEEFRNVIANLKTETVSELSQAIDIMMTILSD